MEQPSVEAEKEIFQEALIEDMFAMAPANMKGYELGNTAGEACMIQPYVKVEKKPMKQDLRKTVMKQHDKMGEVSRLQHQG